MDEMEQDLTGFTPLYAVSQGFGVLAVILTGVWMGHYRGGFAWSSDPVKQFNWHPLLMVMGLIYLYGNGILVYRVFRHERKKKLKVTHAVVNILAFVFSVVALKAVFDYHNSQDINNMYSLHSWLGLITVTLFAFQWLCGLVTFLFPGLASHLRALYLPVHVTLGMAIFVLACVTALLGMTEKAIFSANKENGGYANKSNEGTLVNYLGLSVVGFCVVVVYMVCNPSYKRLTKPEDEILLRETTE